MLTYLFLSTFYAAGLFSTEPAVPPFTGECNRLSSTTCTLYLSSTIESEDTYIPLYKIFSDLTKDDKIVLHLSGSGGSAAALLRLVHVIKSSGAELTVYVDGPVASAHAFLAIQANQLIAAPHTYFLFHRVALGSGETIEETCEAEKGKLDRGLDKKAKCITNLTTEMKIIDDILAKYAGTVLTKSELSRMAKGEDVIILGAEIQKRINK